MPAAGSVSRAAAPIAALSAKRSAMVARTAATDRAPRPTAVAAEATRQALVAEQSARCSVPPARVAARRRRCHSSPAATSRCIARRASSSAAAVATVPAGGAATRAAVATRWRPRWRAASSGDRSDNQETARLIVPESKLLWRLALGDYWQAMTLVRWSRWSTTCGSCATKRTATRTNNPRRMRCARTAARRAS
jgi:hypothetical protein